jgi:hypothetical protein
VSGIGPSDQSKASSCSQFALPDRPLRISSVWHCISVANLRYSGIWMIGVLVHREVRPSVGHFSLNELCDHSKVCNGLVMTFSKFSSISNFWINQVDWKGL